MNTVLYIEISSSCESKEEMSEMLRHIAELIEKGFTSGFQPTWNIKDESFNQHTPEN
jgi:hypothetical protein